MTNPKVCIALDFPNAKAALDWLNDAKFRGIIPEDAYAWQMSGLDHLKGTRITEGNSYVLKRDKGIRPQEFRLDAVVKAIERRRV